MKLDYGLVNKTAKEHVPAECNQARAIKGGAHVFGLGLKAGDSMVQGVGGNDIVGLEGCIPLEGHERGSSIEVDGRSLAHRC